MMKLSKIEQKHLIVVLIGAALGYFYAHQQGQKGWSGAGFAFLGGVIGCLAFRIFLEEKLEKKALAAREQ
jgi:hypothetical protein